MNLLLNFYNSLKKIPPLGGDELNGQVKILAEGEKFHKQSLKRCKQCYRTMGLPAVIYKFIISPTIDRLLGVGPTCRYLPTCSEYTYEAVKQHGIVGLWLGLKRVVRCNPLARGGADRVPANLG